MDKKPLVSVVIPTYNRKKLAERLIKSLLNSAYKNIEIIVIDDASLDKTSDYLETKIKNKRLKIFRNKKNLFAAGSKNTGQKKAKGDYILFIDDDNVADPYMIGNLVEILEENKDIGETGPVNFNFNNKKETIWCKSERNMSTSKTFHHRKLMDEKRGYWETDDVPNAFMVRGEVIKNNKIEFRSKFGIMYEESDYAYRIKKAGYKIVVVKKAKVFHDIESDEGEGKDYLYHFLEDTRRPFVFARNRIIFHSLYSTRLQNLFILSFWIWFFLVYYSLKFLTYRYGSFTIKEKIEAAVSYCKGTFNGLGFAILNSYKV